MKHRKLRGYVLPTLYVIILMFIFGTVSLISTLLNINPHYLYSIGVLNSDTMQVVDTNIDDAKSITKPFTSDKVEVGIKYYDIQDSEDEQQQALIYFENTYMKNTGVFYKSEEVFDVVNVLEGTVLNVKEDELLGNVVEVEHNSNLRTIYYSLGEVNVNVGEVLAQGDVIGVSGANNISDYKYGLLFEVYYNGTLIDPEDFYTMSIDELN